MFGSDLDPDVDELERLAREALPLLEQAADHAGLVHVWRALGFGVANFRGRWDDWTEASEQARRHARLAGQAASPRGAEELALASGSLPADKALLRLDELVPENPHPAMVLVRAWVLAMLGRFEEASAIEQEASDRYVELMGAHWVEWIPAQIAEFAADHEAAARQLRSLCDLLEGDEQRFYLSSVAPAYARVLCATGHDEEADRWIKRTGELDIRTNVLGRALQNQVEALVQSHRGAHAHAEQLAREGVAIIETTDGLNYQDAYCDLSEVLAAAGRTEEAAAALEQALDRYERKKNLAMVTQVRPRLNELRASLTGQ